MQNYKKHFNIANDISVFAIKNALFDENAFFSEQTGGAKCC